MASGAQLFKRPVLEEESGTGAAPFRPHSGGGVGLRNAVQGNPGSGREAGEEGGDVGDRGGVPVVGIDEGEVQLAAAVPGQEVWQIGGGRASVQAPQMRQVWHHFGRRSPDGPGAVEVALAVDVGGDQQRRVWTIQAMDIGEGPEEQGARAAGCDAEFHGARGPHGAHEVVQKQGIAEGDAGADPSRDCKKLRDSADYCVVAIRQAEAAAAGGVPLFQGREAVDSLLRVIFHRRVIGDPAARIEESWAGWCGRFQTSQMITASRRDAIASRLGMNSWPR